MATAVTVGVGSTLWSPRSNELAQEILEMAEGDRNMGNDALETGIWDAVIDERHPARLKELLPMPVGPLFRSSAQKRPPLPGYSFSMPTLTPTSGPTSQLGVPCGGMAVSGSDRRPGALRSEAAIVRLACAALQ